MLWRAPLQRKLLFSFLFPGVSGKLTQELRPHIKYLTRRPNGSWEDSFGITGLVNMFELSLACYIEHMFLKFSSNFKCINVACYSKYSFLFFF